jgi:gamma-glutamylcyclotransferase (GGCT)/AIG2-like uncharacterized protein YtfP
VLQWWQGVHSFVNGERGSYVMDVAWFPSSSSTSSSSKFVLIELSPFFPCTGSALFNWQRDAQLLHDGPYSLRLKDASDVHPQMNELILCNWNSRWPLQDAATLVFVPPFTQVLEEAQQQQQQQQHFIDFGAEYISGAMSSLLGAVFRPAKQLLFVYGTLKRGFQWNTKYMADRLGCSFVCEAVTVQVLPQIAHSFLYVFQILAITRLQPMALVLGESGVPYLLKHMGGQTAADASQLHCIIGELWEVSSEALQGLDEYEGVSKGYYSRATIPVYGTGLFAGLMQRLADVYVLNDVPPELAMRPRINEYTLDMHHRLYNAIVHVQRKQHAYLGWNASTWGKMPAREVCAEGATAES